jgi:hypothetical protein
LSGRIRPWRGGTDKTLALLLEENGTEDPA